MPYQDLSVGSTSSSSSSSSTSGLGARQNTSNNINNNDDGGSWWDSVRSYFSDSGGDSSNVSSPEESSNKANIINFSDDDDNTNAAASVYDEPEMTYEPEVYAAIADAGTASVFYTPDDILQEAYEGDMAGKGNDKPDPQGNMGVPGVTLKDVTDTDEGALSNPDALYKLADDIRENKIQTTVLDDQGKPLVDFNKITNIQDVRSQLDGETDPDKMLAIIKDALEESTVVDLSPPEAGDQALVPTTETVEAVEPVKPFMETPTFKLLEGVEGFKSKPYSLNNKILLGGKPHKSGLTVGAGIDFGQHSEQSLLSMGIPKTMVKKAKDAGWIGLTPDTIIDPKTKKKVATRERGHALMWEKFKEQKAKGTLPVFTKEELSKATPPVYKTYEDAAKKQYEKDTGLSFDDLDVGSKAVLTLEKYHRGVGYELPDAMIIGASQGNATKAAQGTKNAGRRKNLIAWLKKVGLDYDSVRRETSPRPVLRPKGLMSR